MKVSERIEMLRSAAAAISEASDLIKTALSGTNNEAHADAYIIPHLLTWIGEGNPYDKSIDSYIDDLQTEADCQFETTRP